jgi:hypothetical protein
VSPEVILVIVAIGISILIFTGLIKIVKTTVSTALTVALVLLAVQILFGIGPADIWQQINTWLQNLWSN